MGYFVRFDQRGYIRAIEQALEEVMEKVEKEVMEAILLNFGAINIRDIDAQYISAMKQAIRKATVETTAAITSKFRAGYESEPNDSFRLVYYEYGTAQLMKPPKGFMPGEGRWNRNRPARLQEGVWTRPYGRWEDDGGNEHFSKYRGKPRKLSPMSRRAKPIQPHFWFAKGFWAGTSNFDKHVLNAVKSVPIAPYISIADIYKRM